MLSSITRPAALVVGTALAALVLAGCGSDTGSTDTASGGSPTGSRSESAQPSPSATAGRGTEASPSYGPPASGPHDAQDVMFVEDMLPHHTQAVEMADLALARDTTPEVKALAEQIKAAQAPEISTMSGWLAGWGEPVPASDSHSMSGMTGSTGMMSADEMTSLDKATGTGFARRWLTDMTAHHTGAVAMARTEATGGQNADAKKLAAGIVSSQTAEIATMTRLLADLA